MRRKETTEKMAAARQTDRTGGPSTKDGGALDSENSVSETRPEPAKKSPARKEVGGREGPEPTRYGDWEVNGICVDF